MNIPKGAKENSKETPVIAWNNIMNFIIGNVSYKSDQFIYSKQKQSENQFATLLPDASMQPYFLKGSLLIISTSTLIKDRCFVLVKLKDSNSILLLQLLIEGDHKYIKPFNSSHTNALVRLMDNDIIGVMIECHFKYEKLQVNIY